MTPWSPDPASLSCIDPIKKTQAGNLQPVFFIVFPGQAKPLPGKSHGFRP